MNIVIKDKDKYKKVYNPIRLFNKMCFSKDLEGHKCLNDLLNEKYGFEVDYVDVKCKSDDDLINDFLSKREATKLEDDLSEDKTELAYHKRDFRGRDRETISQIFDNCLLLDNSGNKYTLKSLFDKKAKYHGAIYSVSPAYNGRTEITDKYIKGRITKKEVKIIEITN